MDPKLSLLIIIILELRGRETEAQIIDGKKVKQNPDDVRRQAASALPRPADIHAAIGRLTESVSRLTERLGNLEAGLHLRFQVFGESIAKEKMSIETISSRLDVLGYLTVQVRNLDAKVEDETVVLRNALTATNKDVQRLSTQLEQVSRKAKNPRTANLQVKKEAAADAVTDDVTPPRHAHFSSSSSASTNSLPPTSPDQVLWKMERMVPRLMAAELNHFYLNMATKTDHVMGQLQRELVMRLRRIEATGKTALQEIQESRQDTSHLTHIQKTMMSSLKSGSNNSAQISKCTEAMRNELKELKKDLPSQISASVVRTLRELNFTRSQEKQTRVLDKGGPPQPSLSSAPLWRGVLPPGLNRQSTSHVAGPSLRPSQCLDPTAFATLEEVKQLLRSLMSKGEDLRRTLTRQATEGVDLLKLLHQRFSVLLRRINTDPNHGEALLAEVQELEHLVENSYSSILLAQNIFIESCRRIQRQNPSIEGQIVEILNKLVTNIDLGHQFNKNQLREVRKLIQQMKMQDESNGSSLVAEGSPADRTAKARDKKNMYNRPPSSFSDRLFNNLIVTAAEANSTEEKLQLVFDRISDVETELQTLNWNSGNVKNIIDELLTGAKDLKGYSRSQMESLQNFQNDILQFVDNFSLHKSVAPSKNKYPVVAEKHMGENDLNTTEPKSEQDFHTSCLTSVLRTLDSSTLDYSNLDNLTAEQTIKEVLKQVLLNTTPTPSSKHKTAPQTNVTTTPTTPTTTTTTTTATTGIPADDRYLQNVDQFYYDSDEEEMLMDDEYNWNLFPNYYDESDEEEFDESFQVDKKRPPVLSSSKTSYWRRNNDARKAKAKRTVLENDFMIN